MFNTDTDRETFMYELERDGEVRQLVTYLRNSNKEYARKRAATILGNVRAIQNPDDEQQAIDALVAAVHEDESEDVRAAAVDALYQRGSDALATLFRKTADGPADDGALVKQTVAEWLESDQPEFRMVAATAVGEYGYEAALPQVVELLADRDARVRVRAIKACGRIGHPGVIEPLSDRLDDNRGVVQEAAADALGTIGTPEALGCLVPLTRSNNARLRHIAVDELGQFGSLDPARVLIDALDDDSGRVRRAAMLSLLELITRSSTGETETIRRTIAQQVATTEAGETVPPLLEIAREGTREAYRHNALWLLARVAAADNEDVVDCLVSALRESNREIARVATEGLCQLGGPVVEQQLRLMLQDETMDARADERAQRVLNYLSPDGDGELVRTGVDYTYVSEPADYTREKRNSGS